MRIAKRALERLHCLLIHGEQKCSIGMVKRMGDGGGAARIGNCWRYSCAACIEAPAAVLLLARRARSSGTGRCRSPPEAPEAVELRRPGSSSSSSFLLVRLLGFLGFYRSPVAWSLRGEESAPSIAAAPHPSSACCSNLSASTMPRVRAAGG